MAGLGHGLCNGSQALWRKKIKCLLMLGAANAVQSPQGLDHLLFSKVEQLVLYHASTPFWGPRRMFKGNRKIPDTSR